MENLRKNFGSRIKVLRQQLNLTQEDLASLSNISVDFLSLIERGINAPSFETIERLSQALDVPIKELFNFEESKK